MEVQHSWHFSLCPSVMVGAALALSLLVARRKGDGVIEEEGMSLNAPLTPQNEIDKLPEVNAPSTIFFGRKYCYRQIGDSISCRRWGSRLWSKGCVCPLLSRLRCLLMLYLLCLAFSCPPTPLFLYLNHIFFYVRPFSCFDILYFTTPSGTITQHPSPHRFFGFHSLGSLFAIFFCWLCLPEGGNSIFPYPAGIAPSRLFLRLFLCC